MIPRTTPDAIAEAMKRFDREMRDTPEWLDWEKNQAYKYAIEHDGLRYPVKQIVSMATDTPVNSFSGGTEANGYVEEMGFRVVDLRPREPSCWIEKTIVSGRPDRATGPYALGAALWSPQKAKGGQDIYRFMREVKEGDVILHLTDNEGFTGISRAAGPVQEFNGVANTEWGEGPSYLVPLRDFVKLEPPLSRQVFFNSPFKERLVAIIDSGQKHLFYNREPSLNQGAYLTPVPAELLAILNDAYQTAAGKPLPVAQPLRTEESVSVPQNGALPEGRAQVEELLKSLESQGLHFSEELVANYLLALQTKRFVILSGLSGTGKTQLAITIAKHFTPKVTTSEVASIPEGSEVVELRPYMFQHDRLTLPVTIRAQLKLPPPNPGTIGGGQLAVSYPGGRETLAFWRDPNSNGNNLFFTGDDETDHILTAAVMHLALIRWAGNKLADEGDTRAYDYMVHPVFTPYFVFSYRRKRKMTLSASELLGLVREPKDTIRAILGRNNRSETGPLPDQLDFFSEYFGDTRRTRDP